MSNEHFSLALHQAFCAFKTQDTAAFETAVEQAKSELTVHAEAVALLDKAGEFFPDPMALDYLHRAAAYLSYVASLGYCGPERRQQSRRRASRPDGDSTRRKS